MSLEELLSSLIQIQQKTLEQMQLLTEEISQSNAIMNDSLLLLVDLVRDSTGEVSEPAVGSDDRYLS